MQYSFPVNRTTNPKQKPDPNNLVFGATFSDHMFEMSYNTEKGWHDGKIVPYAPLVLDPSVAVLHYAQAMFEGLKAYRAEDGRVLLFRPEKNAERTNVTNERMCIPEIDETLMVEAIKKIVETDQDWIPEAEGTSLYIRPFIIATDTYLGLRPSQTFKFYIILSPVGDYYKGGLSPTKILVEDKYVRAVVGGTGFAKVGGNYAASVKSLEEANKKGYSQVLWLDGVERKYVEEIGTSNAFFQIDGEIVTSPLTGTILPGITRDSVILLLKHWGIKITEKRFTIQDVYDAHAAGKLGEVFATGTAAVISPVGELCWKDQIITINNNEIGEISRKLYDAITGIQRGKIKDEFGWTVEV
ncbi:MAG: branched-chain amino acid aminotransferase [Dethiobacter sp.]|jgi:branched-chain amino acid aminotransferase|nr:branched-chain amino acid aminotransferase [Dethiobacter sp.]